MNFSIGLPIADNRDIHHVISVLIISLPQGDVWDNKWQASMFTSTPLTMLTGSRGVKNESEMIPNVQLQILIYEIYCILSYKNNISTYFKSTLITISNLWVAIKKPRSCIHLLIVSVMAAYTETMNKPAAQYWEWLNS